MIIPNTHLTPSRDTNPSSAKREDAKLRIRTSVRAGGNNDDYKYVNVRR